MSDGDRELYALAERIGYGQIINRTGRLWARALERSGAPMVAAVYGCVLHMEHVAMDMAKQLTGEEPRSGESAVDLIERTAEAGGDEG